MDEKDDERIELIQESLIDDIIPNGNEVLLRLKSEKINVFTEDGSKNIVKGVKNDNK
jgi:iron(III) transport system ATP-binding protein